MMNTPTNQAKESGVSESSVVKKSDNLVRREEEQV